ncbi:hypothetical protein GCM10028814_30310 [Angustibacter aerolatus]
MGVLIGSSSRLRPPVGRLQETFAARAVLALCRRWRHPVRADPLATTSTTSTSAMPAAASTVS